MLLPNLVGFKFRILIWNYSFFFTCPVLCFFSSLDSYCFCLWPVLGVQIPTYSKSNVKIWFLVIIKCFIFRRKNILCLVNYKLVYLWVHIQIHFAHNESDYICKLLVAREKEWTRNINTIHSDWLVSYQNYNSYFVWTRALLLFLEHKWSDIW